jgi:hypothetical protein
MVLISDFEFGWFGRASLALLSMILYLVSIISFFLFQAKGQLKMPPKQNKKYNSKFQDSWLQNELYRDWVEKVDGDKFLARCNVCDDTFSVSGQGASALKSHQKGKNHRARVQHQ